MSSAEARYLKINFDEVVSKIREYARARAHNARAIVLTGSLAKGNYTGISDADILVIADDLPTNVLERYALFAEPMMPIDIEPRVYTLEEFVRKVRQGDHFALESLEIGIPFHGKQLFEDLKESLGRKPHNRTASAQDSSLTQHDLGSVLVSSHSWIERLFRRRV